MLETLDDVDWPHLGTAYENAAGVPDAIRRLASNKPDDWVEAIDFLYGHLCHQQCTVYEATPVAVRFLRELLDSPEVKCRGRIVEFLADVARATSYLDAHQDMTFYDEKRETPEFREQLAKEMTWVRASRAEVWRAVDGFVGLLADDRRTIRISVPYSLALLARHAGDDVPDDVAASNPFARMSQAMSARLEWEAEPLVRASLLYGLAALADRYPENVATLRERLDDESPPIRLAAALCLLDVDADAVPDAALDVLREALEEADRTDAVFDAETPGMESRHHPLSKAYAELDPNLAETAGEFDDVDEEEDFRFPWREHRTRFDVIAAICRLPATHRDRFLPVLVEQVRVANEHTSDSVVAPILSYVFEGRQLTDDAGREGSRVEGQGSRARNVGRISNPSVSGGPTESPRSIHPQDRARAVTRSRSHGRMGNPSHGEVDLSPAERAVLEAAFDNPLLWVTMTYTASAFRPIGLDDDRERWRRLLGRPGEDESTETAARILELVARRSWGVQCRDDEPLTDEHRRAAKQIVVRRLATDAIVPLLADYPMIERLDLCRSPISAAGIRALPTFPNLTALHLSGVELDAAAVDNIAAMTTLRDLNLGDTNLDDALLERLLPLEEVQELGLYGTRVTDAAVDVLVRFRNLTRLALGETAVTDAGFARLRAAFPEIRGLPRE